MLLLINIFWSNSPVFKLITNKTLLNHSKMKSIAFAALTTAAAAISANELEFANYAARFNKVYEDISEFAMRFERFEYWDRVIN